MSASRGDRIAFGLVVQLIVATLAVGLGWTMWLLTGTTSHALAQAPIRLSEYWATCPDAGNDSGFNPVVGPVIGELRLGTRTDFAWPIATGVDAETLRTGVGWYSDTSLPGEAGSFAVAGNRITNGAPFADLLTLPAGEQIFVRTCAAEFRYEIIVPANELTVLATDDWLLHALPNHPGALPTEQLLVLTTHQDLVPTQDRAVAIAKLVETTPTPVG